MDAGPTFVDSLDVVAVRFVGFRIDDEGACVVLLTERLEVHLALHPDDPPWPVLGIPRIITDATALERVLGFQDSPANGLCVLYYQCPRSVNSSQN